MIRNGTRPQRAYADVVVRRAGMSPSSAHRRRSQSPHGTTLTGKHPAITSASFRLRDNNFSPPGTQQRTTWIKDRNPPTTDSPWVSVTTGWPSASECAELCPATFSNVVCVSAAGHCRCRPFRCLFASLKGCPTTNSLPGGLKCPPHDQMRMFRPPPLQDGVRDAS